MLTLTCLHVCRLGGMRPTTMPCTNPRMAGAATAATSQPGSCMAAALDTGQACMGRVLQPCMVSQQLPALGVHRTLWKSW